MGFHGPLEQDEEHSIQAENDGQAQFLPKTTSESDGRICTSFNGGLSCHLETDPSPVIPKENLTDPGLRLKELHLKIHPQNPCPLGAPTALKIHAGTDLGKKKP